MGAIILANELVAVVLNAEHKVSPEEVIRFARENKAVFKKGNEEYVMLQLPEESEPERWGVKTLRSSIGRRALAGVA